MNDEQLTKELEEALAVEPTPQFLARVRREIGTEGNPLSTRLIWTLFAAGTAAVAVVVGIAMFQPSKPIAFQAATVSEDESPLPAPVIPAAPATMSVPTVAAKQLRRRPSEPEILVDPREMAALQSFLNDVGERNIAPAKLEKLFESAKRAERVRIEPMPIAAIEPIVILPLGSAEPETGGDL